MPQVAKNLEECKDEPIIMRVRGNRSVLDKAMLLLSIAVCVIATSCHDAETIWSAEVRSPDGQWVAIGRTDQHSGPGNSSLLTTVILKRTKGTADPIEVLLFEQDSKSIDLKMNWVTSSHLEVTYKQPAVIDFQAIKCAGIDISVREVSGSTINSSQQPERK